MDPYAYDTPVFDGINTATLSAMHAVGDIKPATPAQTAVGIAIAICFFLLVRQIRNVLCRPANPYLWHGWFAFFFVKTIDGVWEIQRLERRMRSDGKWEYRSREETEEEFWDKQI